MGENCWQMKPIILASKSPRRSELLKSIHLDFEIDVSNVEEVIDKRLSVDKAIEKIALSKAKAVAKHHRNKIVIGVDTVVLLDHQILGKPKDQQEAFQMLTMLSGKTHQVLSAVAICFEDKIEMFHEVTKVTFYKLDDKEIQWYITNASPLDKAGAYGIQDFGKVFVKEISGDYYNVVGLPIAKLHQKLKAYQ